MMRAVYLIGGSAAIIAIAIPGLIRINPRLVWNATPSAPIGLYALHHADQLHLGDLVAATPPATTAKLFARRGYLPEHVPLIKYVAALQGQKICRLGVHISVDGRVVADAHLRDSKHRTLPKWQGCVQLDTHQIFLLNPSIADSLDGRYFGTLNVNVVLGRLMPLWTEENIGQPFHWHSFNNPSPQPHP